MVIRSMEQDGRLHPVKLPFRGRPSNFFDPREVELFKPDYVSAQLATTKEIDAKVISWFERTGGDSSPTTLTRIMLNVKGVSVARVKELYQQWMYGVETPTDSKAEETFNAAIERLTSRRKRRSDGG